MPWGSVSTLCVCLHMEHCRVNLRTVEKRELDNFLTNEMRWPFQKPIHQWVLRSQSYKPITYFLLAFYSCCSGRIHTFRICLMEICALCTSVFLLCAMKCCLENLTVKFILPLIQVLRKECNLRSDFMASTMWLGKSWLLIDKDNFSSPEFSLYEGAVLTSLPCFRHNSHFSTLLGSDLCSSECLHLIQTLNFFQLFFDLWGS